MLSILVHSNIKVSVKLKDDRNINFKDEAYINDDSMRNYEWNSNIFFLTVNSISYLFISLIIPVEFNPTWRNNFSKACTFGSGKCWLRISRIQSFLDTFP